MFGMDSAASGRRLGHWGFGHKLGHFVFVQITCMSLELLYFSGVLFNVLFSYTIHCVIRRVIRAANVFFESRVFITR